MQLMTQQIADSEDYKGDAQAQRSFAVPPKLTWNRRKCRAVKALFVGNITTPQKDPGD